jgi:uncharacterized protein YcbK (DUF882 family)|tara:strand:- start:132 stop:485 length:354 start_codon:yes stop_codon:yes gene_type:complete
MRYFTYEEFDSSDEPGSGHKMNPAILNMLDAARKLYGKPMKINSGYRTEKHNTKIGGVKDSSHMKGLAADVRVGSSAERFALYDVFRKVGFKRIGVAKSFIHVDIDEDKTQDLLWVY